MFLLMTDFLDSFHSSTLRRTVAKSLQEESHRETASSPTELPYWRKQLSVFISLLKNRCLKERYKHSALHSAHFHLAARTIWLKTSYRLHPKDQEPRYCPNSQKFLLLTKQLVSATGCDSKVLRLSTLSRICFLSAIWNMLAVSSSNILFPSKCARKPKVSSWEPFSAFNVWYLAHPPTLFSLPSTFCSLFPCCPFWGPDPAQAIVFGVRIQGNIHNLQISSENFPRTRGGEIFPQQNHPPLALLLKTIFSSVLHFLKHTSISMYYSLTKPHILLRLSTVLHLFFPLLFTAH